MRATDCSQRELKELKVEAENLIELQALYLKAGETLPDDWKSALDNFRDKALNAYINLCYNKKAPAYLTLQTGAGGIDAAVWCERLAQMYLNFAKRHELKVEIIDWQVRNDGGIRLATLLFNHPLAFELLKDEKGRHRLVHKSPFDKQNRRHTSFVAVEVWPKIKHSSSKINIADIEIQTFRASGPGGQHRNKVETAIRAIHNPTKIQAIVSAGRSQAANKEAAIALLTSRVQAEEVTKQQLSEKLSKGEKVDAGFGAPRRSYILDGKTRYEDEKTKSKGNNPQKLLAGELDSLLI